jgi:hypothetical protein
LERELTQDSAMSNATPFADYTPSQPRGAAISETAFRWSGTALVGTVWMSATLFRLYILAFYAGSLADGHVSKWNQNLTGLYEPHSPAESAALLAGLGGLASWTARSSSRRACAANSCGPCAS